MRKKVFIACMLLLAGITQGYSQDKTYALSFNISVDGSLKSSHKPEGRLFIFITADPDGQPVNKIWPNSYKSATYIFARNYSSWDIKNKLEIRDSEGWQSWGRIDDCPFDRLPEGNYYVQVLWQQYFDGYGISEYGNIRSHKQELLLNSSQSIEIKLDRLVEASIPGIHPHVKLEKVKSDTLSKWWGRTIFEHAAVMLPSGYFENPDIEYPIYYFVGGGDSDYLAALWQMEDKEFADWWMSDDAPQIIIVYLDGTKNRNIYHVDSDNLGPHGYSLVNEFIPYIEQQYRGTDSPDTRFVGGCSTGGYGSLALQLFYPETFNGVYCYNPDPISFSQLLYINIYEDENFFTDEFGYPTMLNQLGRNNRPISLRDWVALENVMGRSGSYLDSDHMLGIWSAIFGPEGKEGLPAPLWDPRTGHIDHKVAEAWSRYDLSRYIAENWDRIGPDLRDKIFISCKVSDSYFADRAVRVFESTLNELENPEPEAVVDWVPGTGHCIKYFPASKLTHKTALDKIEERLGHLHTSK